jgi:hypothetical protein
LPRLKPDILTLEGSELFPQYRIAILSLSPEMAPSAQPGGLLYSLLDCSIQQWLADRLWLVACGSWPLACGLWLLAVGFWLGHGANKDKLRPRAKG